MNETIETERIKGKYSVKTTVITTFGLIISALIALYGVYLQIQSSDLRDDVDTLKEQVAILQESHRNEIIELGDISESIFGFRQVRDEDGNLINQYLLEVGCDINLHLGSEYKQFHVIVSGEKLDGYCFVTATLDGKYFKSWLIDQYNTDIPINVNISDVQTMTIEATYSKDYPCSGSIIFSDTEIK